MLSTALGSNLFYVYIVLRWVVAVADGVLGEAFCGWQFQ